MFKEQPKGLIVAALANLGERFGYYTMMAILTLFLMSKFGLDEVNAVAIYSVFTAAIYVLALVGGIIADRLHNYKGVISTGIVLMALGYTALMIPSIDSKIYTFAALGIIAFGNGLFKGNLQAVVGQLYDNKKYEHLRDRGFQIFYMFINIGAMFAPFAATSVRDLWLKSQGFLYNSDLSGLCHQSIDGTLSAEGAARFAKLAGEVTISGTPDMATFATTYLGAFNTGFHYAFGVAIIAMLISLTIFFVNKKQLPNPKTVDKKANQVKLTPEEIKADAKNIKQRLYALFAVFAVVIFFWFSFHQNGTTLTLFAKDYTHLEMFGFPISAEIFQSFNPFFVVFLTFVVVAIFSWLSKKGKEPSTPKKIAIGMGIAGSAFVVMALGSIGLPDAAAVKEMGGLDAAARVTPWLLVAVYFILTVAELFISPLGLSFVSKVAPAHLQGVMQGAWLAATALGNGILFIGAIFYKSISIAGTWWIFAAVCGVSMLIMLLMVKWLERVTK